MSKESLDDLDLESLDTLTLEELDDLPLESSWENGDSSSNNVKVRSQGVVFLVVRGLASIKSRQ